MHLFSQQQSWWDFFNFYCGFGSTTTTKMLHIFCLVNPNLQKPTTDAAQHVHQSDINVVFFSFAGSCFADSSLNCTEVKKPRL